MDNAKSEYKSSLVECLGHFQLLESCLKDYLSICHLTIKKRLDGIIPYNFDEKHHEQQSLERLCESFKKYNDNRALHAEIDKMKNKRNDVAHRSYLVLIDSDTKEADLVEKTKMLTELSVSVIDLAQRVIAECRSIEDAYKKL